jgi:hypothetical protein
MGQILSSKVTNDGKVVFTVCLDPEEALQLKGHIDNVHIFSDKITNIKTHLAMRGRHSATRYLLVPKELRKDLKSDSEVSCQRIDTKNKIIFIYVIDKYKL